MKKYPPIQPNYPHILHGGDYNPSQWRETPEIWDEDMRLMKLAGCNAMSVGIFDWSVMEPREGEYDFSCMDRIMDKLEANGAKAVLATPSGARPAWLSEKYPEVLRTREDGVKFYHGGRHNHCFTSPIYREKTQQINHLLAQRYGNHPALAVWHVSNEYGGECHCHLCREAFRQWLRNKYHDDLDELNRQWWTSFWSHTFTSWEQIMPPSSIGEGSIHGLNLDWKRFVAYQTVDFMKNEIAPLKELTPNIPVTTNMMGTWGGMDYHRFRDVVDVVSWDTYPRWHDPSQPSLPSDEGFVHDLNRSIKNGQPFMMMESTPSTQNWAPVNKLKKPNMHQLASLQAVAHGSDTVQYFQWRKSRGGCEKFHGAVVDHVGHEHTRVFQDVARLGADLKKLDAVVGTYVDAKVAVVYDWENSWAVADMAAMKRGDKGYEPLCKQYYYPFWKNGISVDVIEMTQDFSKYRLLVLPMLYLLKPGTIEKIQEYVKNGGTVVASYALGQVNENDLCYLGGFPAEGLKEVFGIWAEEMECLYDCEERHARIEFLGGDYKVRDYCELIHANEAQVLGVYREDFYAGMPALTCNCYGKGKAYYIPFCDTGEFSVDFFEKLIGDLELPKAMDTPMPQMVTAHMREDEDYRYIFVENYTEQNQTLLLPPGEFTDMLAAHRQLEGKLELEPFGARVLRAPKQR